MQLYSFWWYRARFAQALNVTFPSFKLEGSFTSNRHICPHDNVTLYADSDYWLGTFCGSDDVAEARLFIKAAYLISGAKCSRSAAILHIDAFESTLRHISIRCFSYESWLSIILENDWKALELFSFRFSKFSCSACLHILKGQQTIAFEATDAADGLEFCEWIVSTEPGYHWKITVDRIQLEISNSSCQGDYLQVLGLFIVYVCWFQ